MGDGKKKIESKQEEAEEAEASKSNLFLGFPKIELKIPPFFNMKDVASGKEEEKKTTSHKHEVVRFGEPKPVTPPPLKIQNDEPVKLSHPLAVFPVCKFSSLYMYFINFYFFFFKKY